MRFIIIIFFILITSNSLGQNQTSNWVFGNNAHIEFSNNQINIHNNSELLSARGSSTISDENGNLLFYTDGSKVWNRLHQRVFSTSGESLISNDIGAQNSIIIPKPNSSSLFYIFTIKAFDDDNNSDTDGLYYSILDITKHNNLGLIIETNVLVQKNVVGRLTAVHHKNGKDVWLVTNGKKNLDDEFYDTFFSILVDDTKVNTPIISENGFLSIFDALGQIKLSPDGQRLACATNGSGALVFYFDNETGVISNPRRYAMSTAPGDRTFPYGVEFSNDSKLVYFDATDSSGKSRLYQFDLIKSRNAYAILTRRNKIKGALQLGKDGKIYNAVNFGDGFFEGAPTLSVINNPLGKTVSEIDLQEDVINVAPGLSRLGLPSFIQSYFRTRITTIKGCLNKPTLMEVDTYSTPTSIEWDFGDGNSSNEIKPNHTYTSEGIFKVTAKVIINNSSLNLVKNITVYKIPVLQSNQKLIQCDVDPDGLSTFNLLDITAKITNPSLEETLTFYETLAHAEQEVNKILTTTYDNKIPNQEIFVRVTNKNGCFEITSFILEAKFTVLGDINDTIVCDNSDNDNGNQLGSYLTKSKEQEIKTQLNLSNTINLRFFKSLPDLLSSSNEFTENISSNSGEIWVKAEETNECGGIGKFNFIVNSVPVLNLKNSYSICYNPTFHSPIILNADLSNDRFEWINIDGQIISTEPSFQLTNTGNFSLKVYKTENNIECSNQKDFNVRNPEEPIFKTINVNTDDVNNNIVEVIINGNSNYEFSLDNINFEGNATSHTFSNVKPGLRTIYIRDVYNCEKPILTKASVLGFRKYFTPNGDGNRDYWNVNGLDANFYKSVNIVIFNRFGKIIGKITDFNTQGWDGRYKGKLMQSNNYWFVAEIVDIDNNYIKKSGHFSLIQN